MYGIRSSVSIDSYRYSTLARNTYWAAPRAQRRSEALVFCLLSSPGSHARLQPQNMPQFKVRHGISLDKPPLVHLLR